MEINNIDDLHSMLAEQGVSQEDLGQQAAPVAEAEVSTAIAGEAPVQTAVEQSPAPVAPEAPAAPAPAKETAQSAARKVLAALNIDLSAINIRKSDNPLGTHQEMDTLFLKPSFEIVALQSGYRAAFRALNNDDMIKVRKFTGTEKEQNLKLFNFTYSKMVNANFGKIDFDLWLKITSEADFETLIYGIYCATFPEEGDYNVICGSCEKTNKAKISKELLIQAKDENEVGSYIRDLLSKNLPANELVKSSVVNNTRRIILPVSKTVLDLTTPTLHDYIRTLNRAEQHPAVEPEIFGYLKHIGTMAIPHIQALSEGRLEFIELETIQDKIRVIIDIDPEDKAFLDKEISAKMDAFKVSYKLPNLKCGHCGEMITDITVDLTNTLFQSIARVQ
jgi:hypothetical protein